MGQYFAFKIDINIEIESDVIMRYVAYSIEPFTEFTNFSKLDYKKVKKTAFDNYLIDCQDYLEICDVNYEFYVQYTTIPYEEIMKKKDNMYLVFMVEDNPSQYDIKGYWFAFVENVFDVKFNLTKTDELTYKKYYDECKKYFNDIEYNWRIEEDDDDRLKESDNSVTVKITILTYQEIQLESFKSNFIVQ